MSVSSDSLLASLHSVLVKRLYLSGFLSLHFLHTRTSNTLRNW